MENEETDNAKIKPERGRVCELCLQFIPLKPDDLHFKSFTPFICDPCYQEIEF